MGWTTPNPYTDDEILTKLEKINLSSYENISLLKHNETSPIQFGWVFDEIWSKILSQWNVSQKGVLTTKVDCKS